MAYNIKTFAHGLTLVHQHTPGTDVVAIDVWVKAGAVFEPDHQAGMAHFLEHLIFKGTDRIAPGEFDHAVECHGGLTNAATSHDYAHYYMVMAAAHVPSTLPYLADLLINASIPAAEFEAERQVVFEELRQAGDSPDYVGFEALNQLIYQQHPYRRPILGSVETLQSLTPEAVRQFHRSHYRPEQMTVVMVGDLDFAAAIAGVTECFGDFPAPNSLPPSLSPSLPQLMAPTPESTLAPPIAEPDLTGIRRQVLTMPTIEQARLMMAWLTPGWTQDLRTGYVLDLITVLLTGGRTSRLVQELVEQRELVYGIDASFALQRDSGLFVLTAWLEADQLATVEAICGDRIAQLAATGITPAELSRSQRLLCNEQAYMTETPDQIAGLYGYYALMNQLAMAAEYIENIRSITAAEVQAIAQQFLPVDRYACIVMRSADA